ncbi:MAG: DUF427 domain-containing protein [Gemmatimonadota bacterium]|nr:MAG: DUF427 domain-containing protein [Gemmatimonadota bacterium]
MRDLLLFLRQSRGRWRYRGQTRPDFAIEPTEDQESVWDYPRPPRLERDGRRVEVRSGDVLVADSRRAIRVLETASPPTFYLPPDDVSREHLERASGTSICEWKGQADYWSLRLGERLIEKVAWSYAAPLEGFEAIADYFSFYPARVECRVDGQRVEPQPGGFYGGWVTAEIVGPFKGEPGTGAW